MRIAPILLALERVLVTGAQGFLGRHVVATFLAAGEAATVVGVGRSPRNDTHFTYDLEWTGRRAPAPLPADLLGTARHERYRYEPVDMRNQGEVAGLLAVERPGVVAHSAAALRDEPWESLVESNIQAVVGLLKAIAEVRGLHPKVVLMSSGSVYGTTPPDRLPHLEDHPCVPADLYAASKRAAEDVARILGATSDIPVVVARVFNLLGAGLQDRHLAASLAGQAAEAALGLRPPVLRAGRMVTTRDFVDVHDAASAIRILAAHAGPGTFNVASGEETPVQRIFDELVERAGIAEQVTVDLQPSRRADVTRSFADISRLDALGYRAEHTLGRSLQEMLDYYRDVVALA